MKKSRARRSVDSKPKARRALPWREWLAQRLLLPGTARSIFPALRRKGVSAARARREFRRLDADPVFLAARQICHRYSKAVSLSQALAELHRESPHADGVPVLDRISPSAFFDHYYYTNRPVVVRGLMRGWPALRRWTPGQLARRFGDERVDIAHRRNRNPDHDLDFADHRTTVPFREYVRWLQTKGATNDYYLAARNDLLRRREFSSLFDDFKCPKGFLDPRRVTSDANFWFGPKGTLTQLHHDASNNFFGQVYGRKHFKLISPFELPNVYSDRHVFSSVDLERIDYRRFPLMNQVRVIDVVLRPGDFLFIPIGWLHWVKSLDVSISLNFFNFCTPRRIVWDYRRNT